MDIETSWRIRHYESGGKPHITDESLVTDIDASWELRNVLVDGLGPIIMDESLEETWPERAQQRLYEWIRVQPPEVLGRFDMEHARAEYGGADTFFMHAGKFMVSMLVMLRQEDLVWEGNVRTQFQRFPLALHPRLGQAIMSVMAIAIAEQKQLNIVTPEPRVHRALLTRREEDVLASLAVPHDAPDCEAQSADIATSAAQLLIHKKWPVGEPRTLGSPAQDAAMVSDPRLVGELARACDAGAAAWWERRPARYRR